MIRQLGNLQTALLTNSGELLNEILAADAQLLYNSYEAIVTTPERVSAYIQANFFKHTSASIDIHNPAVPTLTLHSKEGALSVTIQLGREDKISVLRINQQIPSKL